MTAYPRTNLAAAFDRTPDQRQVFSTHRTCRQLLDQCLMCAQILGDDQRTASVLIQPMYYAGTRQRGQTRGPVQQSVEQRSIAITSRGVHDESRRLVDY